MSEKIFLR